MNIRVGHGIDVHKLEKKYPLILGGIKIESKKGIKAYSDGDIIIHAIIDALLGSLSLGDIGTHFPSSNPKWKNCDSGILLKNILKKVSDLKFKISNIDVTVLLQKPPINPFVDLIKNNISKLMKLNKYQISIKATTTDYLGFVGNEEGIAVTATVLVYQEKE